VAIVFVSLAGLVYVGTYAGVRVAPLAVAFLLLALVGLRDDLRPVPARVRLLLQIAAAAIVVAGCGYFRSVSLPGVGELPLGWFGAVATCIWIVGMMNAFNFMDGIDGIAGGQALVAAIGWCLIALRLGDTTLFLLAGWIGAAVLGFLVHNWWPARIFMGDSASAPLGLLFASLPLVAPSPDPLLLPAALLLWPFILDTFFTFVRRALRRENVMEAHRSHLYQRLVIAGYSHATVALLYIALAATGVFAALWILR
jgi:UDP-N-acetylmuramyl pentapeptide phosphotransferase/UDP-N-acetylglucosamine-1-phosphate transferase